MLRVPCLWRAAPLAAFVRPAAARGPRVVPVCLASGAARCGPPTTSSSCLHLLRYSSSPYAVRHCTTSARLLAREVPMPTPTPTRTAPRSSTLALGRRRLRRSFDRVPPDALVYLLIGLNAAVYFAWEYAEGLARRFRDPELLFAMRRHFVASYQNLVEGRPWVTLTSCFSHSSGVHLLVNMATLYFAAPSCIALVGVSRFLGLYLSSGVVASLAWIAWSATSGRGATGGAEGASGAVLGALSFWAACFPSARVLVFFVVPLPAWAAVAGLFCWDLYSSLGRPHSTVASAGHLGGIVTGLLWFARLRARL